MKKFVFPENKSVKDFRVIGGINGEDAIEPGPWAPPVCGFALAPALIPGAGAGAGAVGGVPALCEIRLPDPVPDPDPERLFNDLFFFDIIILPLYYYYYHRQLFLPSAPVNTRIMNVYAPQTHFSRFAFLDVLSY